MRIPDLSDIPEVSPVPEGEYQLKVRKAKNQVSDNTGRAGMLLVLQILGEPNAGSVFHTLWYPFEHEDEEKQTVMWRMVKEFIDRIGLDSSASPEPKDFEGIEFSAKLRLNTDLDRPRNEIERVI